MLLLSGKKTQSPHASPTRLGPPGRKEWASTLPPPPSKTEHHQFLKAFSSRLGPELPLPLPPSSSPSSLSQQLTVNDLHLLRLVVSASESAQILDCFERTMRRWGGFSQITLAVARGAEQGAEQRAELQNKQRQQRQQQQQQQKQKPPQQQQHHVNNNDNENPHHLHDMHPHVFGALSARVKTRAAQLWRRLSPTEIRRWARERLSVAEDESKREKERWRRRRDKAREKAREMMAKEKARDKARDKARGVGKGKKRKGVTVIRIDSSDEQEYTAKSSPIKRAKISTDTAMTRVAINPRLLNLSTPSALAAAFTGMLTPDVGEAIIKQKITGTMLADELSLGLEAFQSLMKDSLDLTADQVATIEAKVVVVQK
jgi:hypothetical protein